MTKRLSQVIGGPRSGAPSRNAPTWPGRVQPVESRPSIEQLRQGIYRITVVGALSDGTSYGTIGARINVPGRRLVYPRGENGLEALSVWFGGLPGTPPSDAPLVIYPGSVIDIPFNSGSIYVQKGAVNLNGSPVSHVSPIVVYVVEDDTHTNWREGVTGSAMLTGLPPSLFFEDPVGGANGWDLTARRPPGYAAPYALFTSPPTVNDVGWSLNKIARITFMVADDNAAAVTCDGTTLRLWWNFGISSVTLTGGVSKNIIDKGSTSGLGWFPSADVFVVSATERIFTVELNVSPGYSPSAGQTTLALVPGLGSVITTPAPLFTVQSSAIPATSLPILVMIGQSYL